jgi:hypothetical protein
MVNIRIPMVTNCQLCTNKVTVTRENRLNNSICQDCFGDEHKTASLQEVLSENIDRKDLQEYHYKRYIRVSRKDFDEQIKQCYGDGLTCSDILSLSESPQYCLWTPTDRQELIELVCKLADKDVNEVVSNKIVQTFITYGMHLYEKDRYFLDWIRTTF